MFMLILHILTNFLNLKLKTMDTYFNLSKKNILRGLNTSSNMLSANYLSYLSISINNTSLYLISINNTINLYRPYNSLDIGRMSIKIIVDIE
jgi:hypothetical protein